MIIPTTKTIARLPHLSTFLADCPDAVAGWGRKPSGRRALWLSRILGRRLALLEDGFIRSVRRDAPTLSLLVDDLGVYYDASRPSRMETAIAARIDGAQGERASRLVRAWQEGGISKYNHAPEYAGPLPERYILVADQTFGDLSIAGGLADAASFGRMLEAAVAENPGHQVLLKIHPDVRAGRKYGHFPNFEHLPSRVIILDRDCHPNRLIRHADAVYTVTSLIGFEALLYQKRVRCFGMPFYAGWGITRDELPPPARRAPVGIESLVHAALITLARYANPRDGAAWQAEEAIAHVARQRRELFGAAVAQPGASGADDRAE